MISAQNCKIIQIDIKTFRKEKRPYTRDMDDSRYCRDNQNRFICSICLNKKPSVDEDRTIECYKRKSRSCPVCQRNYDVDEYADSIVKKDSNVETKYENKEKFETCERKCCPRKEINGKNVQTSQPDVTQGLTLLNEVLTVFQSKKQFDKKEKSNKTIILKDACVSTDSITNNSKPKLTLSRVIHYSIEGNKQTENCKFTILNHQPDNITKSHSIDLTKHKSSSIPQMKLEELKNSLKEKTKSKDAIEEVNRMFATVRKLDISDSLDDINRPKIRNGPRVLPVVKTDVVDNNARNDGTICKGCNFMSGGDSIKQEGCHKVDERCNDCRISCCRHIHHRSPVSENICDHCRNRKSDRSH